MTAQILNREGGRKTLKGAVVSDRMDKTIVVKVEQRKKHPRYHKFVKHTRRFKAHDAANQYHTGDAVIIRESRPLSRGKRWVVVGLVGEAKNTQKEAENNKEETVE